MKKEKPVKPVVRISVDVDRNLLADAKPEMIRRGETLADVVRASVQEYADRARERM